MIKDGIDFHNVEEFIPLERGYRLSRLPKRITERMDEGASDVACHSSGVELRFKIKGDKAVLKLRTEKSAEAQTAYIYYGSFQGGWENSSRMILTEETSLVVEKPKNLDVLKQVAEEKGAGFNPEVVRVVLPYGACIYLGAEGELEPPSAGDYPEKTYLAYGSSITHGSLALAMPYTYPFQIAQRLGCDYLNLGEAGSARAERPLAEYLTERRDWDFASVELGINMLKQFSEEEFEKRVREFLSILDRDGRPVFVTSIFVCLGEDQRKADHFRKIIRDCAAKDCKSGRLIFTDGLDLLNDPAGISQDLVHPSLEGMRKIADTWCDIMKSYL